MKKVNRPGGSSKRVRVTPARWTAFRVLQEFRDSNRFIDEILYSEIQKSGISSEDRRLAHQIVYGTFRNLHRLDFWIDRMSSKGIESLPTSIVDILRLGLFQLVFLDRIPSHAVVDESVRLCEAVSMTPIKGLVNAILRRFPDKRTVLDQAIKESPRRLSIESSHPQWLVDWAMRTFDKDRAQRWLMTNNEAPPTYISPLVSRHHENDSLTYSERISRATKNLLHEAAEAQATVDGEAIEWSSGQSLAEFQPLEEGRAYVQDPGARDAVRLLDPQPGEVVFDLCSAPGGKTLQMADTMNGQGRLVSVDSNSYRLKRLRENLGRCGFEWVDIQKRDLTKHWEEECGVADAVLVDVPCSGLGTLRRKVDLRYRLNPDDIGDLAMKSRAILETASRLVKPGGRLVFSTCTLTEEENRGTLDRFLDRHPGTWRLLEEKRSPQWLYEDRVSEEIPDSDGSYCVRIERA